MARKKIRIGFVGCGGNMRGPHLRAVQNDRNVDLIAVADPSKKQADLLLEQYRQDVPWYTDHRQMLRCEELDAVVVSTPHSAHYGQVRLALECGLHTLVEKPLTTTSRRARSLIDLAHRKKRRLVVSYQRNYYAPYVYARELIKRGEIGTIRSVVSYVTQNWARVGGWRLDPELSGGGMFMDTGSHLVASTLWMTGLQPVEVFSTMDNAGKKVDVNAVLTVRFDGGAIGTLNTIGNACFHNERISIHGNKGVITLDLHEWKNAGAQLNGEPMKIPKRIAEGAPDKSFFNWIRNGGRGYEPALFAVEVARLSELAYKAAARQRPVRLSV